MDLDTFFEELNIEESKPQEPPIKSSGNKRRSTKCLELSLKYEYRRAFSETKLLDCVNFNFKNNHSYNFITAGDVDALSFLKTILRQQNLDYLLFSTWCMAAEDIFQLGLWLEEGKIKKMDAYVGEIFKGTYRVEYELLSEIINKYKCGRLAMFRNHSKIFAGKGDKFAFGIQTSANINTNPRTENACITINDEIFEFYKKYFDGIISYGTA